MEIDYTKKGQKIETYLQYTLKKYPFTVHLFKKHLFYDQCVASLQFLAKVLQTIFISHVKRTFQFP